MITSVNNNCFPNQFNYIILCCSWLSLISIHHFTTQASTSHNTITRIIRDDNIIVAVILHLEVMLRKPPRNSYR